MIGIAVRGARRSPPARDVLLVAVASLYFVAPAAAGKQLYWTGSDYPTNTVQRLDVDGTDRQVLASGSSGNVGPLPHYFLPCGIAVDPVGGHVYWTDTSGNKITRSDLNGGSITDLVTGLWDPKALALDL